VIGKVFARVFNADVGKKIVVKDTLGNEMNLK